MGDGFSADGALMERYGVSAADLAPASAEDRQATDRARPSESYWRGAAKRFARNKVGMAMLIVLAIVVLFAILGPIVSPYTYHGQSRDVRQGPSAAHLFGTDRLGRDVFTRVMFGTRISLFVGVVTSFSVLIVGLAYGGISAYVGGWVDNVMMRFVDLMMTIPTILIIIILSVATRDIFTSLLADPRYAAIASMGSGLMSILAVFSMFNWIGMARTVRGALLMNRSQEYVMASESFGAKAGWIITKHLLPNSIGIVIINATAVIPGAIAMESFLSFIGLGVAAPVPSLGSLAADALNGIISYPLNILVSSGLISIIMLSFNVIGDTLRDALDPRLRR
ncbi:MAG: ABC transporter permease [Clostridiales bacterium]|jgi:oligopeptide transport system permease protein|nr:ABC transporter permease [Clostridiales bacterium]